MLPVGAVDNTVTFVAVTVPPIFKSPPIPTPPATVNAPVLVLPVGAVDNTVAVFVTIIPPLETQLPMPSNNQEI